MSSFPQEYCGQNPIPKFAPIVFFTAEILSLSKIIFGRIPASWQYLSQIVRKCFEPERAIKFSFFISSSEIDFKFEKRGIFGTARKIFSEQTKTLSFSFSFC